MSELQLFAVFCCCVSGAGYFWMDAKDRQPWRMRYLADHVIALALIGAAIVVARMMP